MSRGGLFISFEGIDGCGKTTQTKLLAKYLEAQGTPYIITREPGGEPLAEKIRNILLENNGETWEYESEILLFLAARIQHVRRIIIPALKANKIVICDRFIDSSRIYQGVAKNISSEFYDILHRLTLGNFKPHLTFLLDVPAEIGLNRVRERNQQPDYFEALGLAFHQKLRAGFLQLAQSEPQRIMQLDGTVPPEKIHQHITRHITLWQD